MIALTDAEWTALEGWRQAGEENWEDSLGSSEVDAVRWAEEAGEPLPTDVDQDAAEGWLHFRRMKARIAARQITDQDLASLQTYGEALSWDETAESSVDRSAWEKVYAYTRNPGSPNLIRWVGTAALAALGILGAVMGYRLRDAQPPQ